MTCRTLPSFHTYPPRSCFKPVLTLLRGPPHRPACACQSVHVQGGADWGPGWLTRTAVCVSSCRKLESHDTLMHTHTPILNSSSHENTLSHIPLVSHSFNLDFTIYSQFQRPLHQIFSFFSARFCPCFLIIITVLFCPFTFYCSSVCILSACERGSGDCDLLPVSQIKKKERCRLLLSQGVCLVVR